MHKFVHPVQLPADPTQPLEAATKQYVDANAGGSSDPIELDDLTDVVAPSPTNTQVLTFNGTNWVNADPPTGGGSTVINLDDLDDVVAPSPTNTQVLTFNGTNWVNAAAPTGGTPIVNLDDLTDVVAPSPSTSQVLTFNGTNWVNAAPPTGGSGSGGTGVSAGSIVVAARNATTAQKAAADFTCPATLSNDTTIIQQAIDSVLPSGGSNFTILLTQGTFTVKTPIRLKTGTKIMGMSRDGTIIKIDSSFTGGGVFVLNDTNVHATELGNFRIDGNNHAGTKVNGVWFNNNGGNFSDPPSTDPDPVHYMHDIYMLNVSGNGFCLSTQQSPTITSNNDSTSNCRETVIYNTIVRSPGEHGYWLNTPDSRYISVGASSAGDNYGGEANAGALTNPRPCLVLKGGNSRIDTSKVYSGNSHGFWLDADRAQVTNSEAQDCGDHGWYIRSRHTTYVNIVADSCGRLTGQTAGTPANPNAAGIYISGYNNMIHGQVKLRHRTNWNETYYQQYAINFDTNAHGGGFNIIEIHSQLTKSGSPAYKSGWYTGAPKARYMRLTNDDSATAPAFWIDNDPASFGGSSGGGTTGAWPHQVDYDTEPSYGPEYRVKNLYYDGTSGQRDNFSIWTGVPGGTELKTFWINEWGGLRINPLNTGFALEDASIRIIRGSDTLGHGPAIEYLSSRTDAAGNPITAQKLMQVDWNGNLVAPNIDGMISVYGPLDTPDDPFNSTFVHDGFLFARWLGTGLPNQPMTDKVGVEGDTTFNSVSSVNIPQLTSGYIVATVSAGRPTSGYNVSSVTQKFVTQQSCVTKFNFISNTIPAGSSAAILNGFGGGPTKKFAVRVTTGGQIRLVNSADTTLATTTATITAGTEYVLHAKCRMTGATTAVVSATLCNAAGTPISGGYITGTITDAAPLTAFEYGVAYFNTTSETYTVKVRNIYAQKGNASDTEIVTRSTMAVELASKAYVDSLLAPLKQEIQRLKGDSNG